MHVVPGRTITLLTLCAWALGLGIASAGGFWALCFLAGAIWAACRVCRVLKRALG